MEWIKFASAFFAAAILAGCTSAGDHQEGAGKPTAAAASFPGGVYITRGGWGELRLHEEEAGRFSFQLDTESSGNGCSLAGVASETPGILKVDVAAEQCALTMRRTERGIYVRSTSADTCDAYCGKNAGFQGEYLDMPGFCAPANIRAVLGNSGAEVVAGERNESPSDLATILEQCAATLPYSIEADLRVQLASAYQQSGEKALCLEVLSIYAEDAAAPDEWLADGMSADSARQFLSVMDAVRPLIARCEGKGS